MAAKSIQVQAGFAKHVSLVVYCPQSFVTGGSRVGVNVLVQVGQGRGVDVLVGVAVKVKVGV